MKRAITFQFVVALNGMTGWKLRRNSARSSRSPPLVKLNCSGTAVRSATGFCVCLASALTSCCGSAGGGWGGVCANATRAPRVRDNRNPMRCFMVLLPSSDRRRRCARANNPEGRHPRAERARFEAEQIGGAATALDTSAGEGEYVGNVSALNGAERPVGGEDARQPGEECSRTRDAVLRHPTAKRAGRQPEERGGATVTFDLTNRERQGLHDVLSLHQPHRCRPRTAPPS